MPLPPPPPLLELLPPGMLPLPMLPKPAKLPGKLVILDSRLPGFCASAMASRAIVFIKVTGTVAHRLRIRGSSWPGNFISSCASGMPTEAGMAASPDPLARAARFASGLPMASAAFTVAIFLALVSLAVFAEASRGERIKVEPAPESTEENGLPTSVQCWFSVSA